MSLMKNILGAKSFSNLENKDRLCSHCCAKYKKGLRVRSISYYLCLLCLQAAVSYLVPALCNSIRTNPAQKCIECWPGVRFPTIPYPPLRWSPAEWPWRRADRCDPAGSWLADKTCWLHGTARQICPPHAYLQTRSDTGENKYMLCILLLLKSCQINIITPYQNTS